VLKRVKELVINISGFKGLFKYNNAINTLIFKTYFTSLKYKLKIFILCLFNIKGDYNIKEIIKKELNKRIII
jgi:hypothetical protein